MYSSLIYIVMNVYSILPSLWCRLPAPAGGGGSARCYSRSRPSVAGSSGPVPQVCSISNPATSQLIKKPHGRRGRVTQTNEVKWTQTHVFDVKKHSGCPVCWRGQRKGHQVILLVHDSWLVDVDAVVICGWDSNDLGGLTEAHAGQPKRHVMYQPVAESDACTWEWSRGAPKCPVRMMPMMTKSRETERESQKALRGRCTVEVAGRSPSWKDVSTQNTQRKSLKSNLTCSHH